MNLLDTDFSSSAAAAAASSTVMDGPQYNTQSERVIMSSCFNDGVVTDGGGGHHCILLKPRKEEERIKCSAVIKECGVAAKLRYVYVSLVVGWLKNATQHRTQTRGGGRDVEGKCTGTRRRSSTFYTCLLAGLLGEPRESAI